MSGDKKKTTAVSGGKSSKEGFDTQIPNIAVLAVLEGKCVSMDKTPLKG